MKPGTVKPVNKSTSIANLSSTVQDNGRRGMPKMGCDCMQCFGRCIVDGDQAVRDQALKNDAARRYDLSEEDAT